MIISSSYHTHTIARLQHLLRALGREGEESKRVTDGTPREQIDEGETRRVLVVVMKDASFARASPASKCVSPFCVGKPTRSTCARWYGKKTYRPSDNANALAALMVILTSSNPRGDARAAAVRVCFATRL